MSRKLSASLSLLLLVGCLETKPTPTPDVSPPPSSTFGFEVSIPPTMPNRSDALQLAAVFDEFARLLEQDGHSTEPVVSDTKGLETRLASMSNYFYLDHRLSTDAFLNVLVAVQQREIPQGDDATALTPELRRKAVEIYRATAYGLRQVK